ncbi:EAL domain-containing protein [Thalassotalea euphylliae]|uniref:EAL domain-containing protein n=1 Tax=Thalassotalea euphylliae TaxID=1655234 RepID=A0A3E0TMU7_9GAMM|nr:EAL domain-containing protein [Thalassotalea euphylliae]REL25667.1 EAL domain-containing protein [Thalassotalea euphylliae]
MLKLLNHYKSILLTLVIGVVMACSAFAVIKYYERQQLADQFHAKFTDKVTGLSQAIIAIEKVLIASQQMIEVYPALSRTQFAQLINEELLASTVIQGVQWAPFVPNTSIKAFEQQMQSSGIFDYRIHHVNNKQRCNNSSSAGIFAIAYAEPAATLGHELGLDLSSDCQLNHDMQQAVNENRITTSHFATEQGEVGVRLFVPVVQKERHLGFIVGLVMINQLVDSLWGNLTQSDNFVLTMHNKVAGDKGITLNNLYDSQWLNHCDKANNCAESAPIFTETATVPFANQQWLFKFSQQNLSDKENYYAYLAALLLMLITGGLGYYLYTNINRIKWANALVEEKTASLKFQATHDQLTGLLNKKSLFDYLSARIDSSESSTSPTSFSVLFIDLDHFKRINDTMGHIVGDQILQQVAKRIRTNSRSQDLLFRFGGDEFVVVLQNIQAQQQVTEVAQRYLDALKKPYELHSNHYTIGASIGATTINNADFNPEDILRNADIAMYQAKDSGRGQVIFFHHKMYDDVVHLHRLEFDLEQAIRDDQFVLYYQPIFNSTQQLVGFEALARWQHPSKGLVMPLDFVPLIEKTNKIKAFGALIAKKAIRQLAKHVDYYGQNNCPYISINVSALQLADSDIVDLIAKQLAHYQLPPKLLAIELTESALINNHQLVQTHLMQLSAMGVKVYLDDFGTGYSSLSLLQHLRIDVLKIDRCFIAALGDKTPEAENLVKAIIHMAQALHMEVIAEGIEDTNAIAQLTQFGCHAFQGYYFAKPLAEPQLAKFMQPRLLPLAPTTQQAG